MKKLKFLNILMLVVMIVPFIASCGSDDKDSNNVPAEELAKMAVGTWMCTESIDTYQGESARDLQVGKEITIKGDGTYTSTSSSMGYSGTYTTSGNSFTAKSSAGTFVVSVTINGNKMTWNGTASNGVSFKYIFTKE